MFTSTLSLSWSSLISMISPEKSANGPSLTRTVSPISYSRRGLRSEDLLLGHEADSLRTRGFNSLLQLGDFGELELDGRLPPEDVHEHLELELVLVDLDDLAGEVGERAFLDPHGLAHLVLEAGLEIGRPSSWP